MMPIFSAIAILLLSVNILLGIPKAVNFAQTTVFANNVPDNQLVSKENAKNYQREIQKESLSPKPQGVPAPTISSTAALVEDLDSATLLFVKDPHKRVPIASTTKIMTALVASSFFKPNDILIVPENITEILGSSMNLKAGEQLTFRSLLYGMLLNSGNDAAYTIAANFPGGVPAFVKAMNFKAGELRLLNTYFDNPAGFDSPNHFSSAADLAKIAALAMTDSQLARIVATKETSVASVDKSNIHYLKNLNKLLGTSGVLGIKTGTTPAAKENLVALVERNNHKVLIIVLGSDDRFGETQKLIDWTFTNFKWE